MSKIGDFFKREGLPSLRDNYITYLLLVTNILLFFICTLHANLMYNKGALYAPAVVEQKEYYRLITSMFLHDGVSHIGSNMLILGAMGFLLESRSGHLKFGLCYFGAGIGGGLCSMAYAYHVGKFTFSVGASGAIFGLMGILLYLVIRHRGAYGGITLPRMLFGVACSVYLGVTSQNVDNAAHIGGLITGFVLMGILDMVIPEKRGGKE